MAVTQLDIFNSVYNLTGQHPQLPSATLNEFIKTENQEILQSWNWSRRRSSVLISTFMPVTTGTISVTQGNNTVTGAGTSFSSSNAGQYIRVSGQDQYFKISSAASATSLSLEINFPSVSMSAVGYSIFQTIYAMPSTCEKITYIISNNQPLLEKPRELINRLDPARQSSATDPTVWCYADRDSNNNIQFEVWPPTADAHALRIGYSLIGDVVNSTDVPLYRADVLKWKAAVDAAEYLDSKTENRAWGAKAERWYKMYLTAFEEAKLDDMEKISTAENMMPQNMNIGLSDTYLLSHDIEGIN